MILRSNTVVELQPGTRINLAGQVAPLALSGPVLAKLLHDEGYAALGGAPGGFLNGAYMELLMDAAATDEGGATVSLGRGTWVFVDPGSTIALISKAGDGSDKASSSGFALPFSVGVGLFACLLGVAIGSRG
jgi:hypothetical protein